VLGSTKRFTTVVGRGDDGLPDEVALDRELAVAPVDQREEADRGGPPVVHQRAERGADRPAREEDVVDEEEVAVGRVEGDLGQARERETPVEVVAVERHVDLAEGRDDAVGLLQPGRDAAREGDAPGREADEGQRREGGDLLPDPGGKIVEEAVEAGAVDEREGRGENLRHAHRISGGGPERPTGKSPPRPGRAVEGDG
jgi:hypothetical protein